MSIGKSYVYAYGQLLQETSVVRTDGINRRDNLLKTSPLEVILQWVKYWTGPFARRNSAERRETALEEMRAAANS